MVNEDQLRLTRWFAADEDVSWMGITVHPAPEEHLGGEEVDHGRHHIFQGDSQAAFSVGAFPVVALGFDFDQIGIPGHPRRQVFGHSGIESGAVAAGCSLAPAATPWPGEGVLVP